ncbi:MAG: agmatine deiminase family protein [Bacteroidaceae bacterium]|nr:agmatine deiminase family protein [Bacteroidaceae bacterium]
MLRTMTNFRLPAEWEPQSGVQLTWPHAATDWADMLDVVDETYVEMARHIASHERLLIVTPEVERVRSLCRGIDALYIKCPSNDTWARDHAFITVEEANGSHHLLDFGFNGWGMKFAANLDNCINRHVFDSGCMHGSYASHLDFTLEGGSIESDGHGTILTTSRCLMSHNRNEWLSRPQIEEQLRQRLGAKRVLWLDYGAVDGDDTDSHIDTLARLCPNDTILYICDSHSDELNRMEAQLREFQTDDGRPYRLVPLPSPTPMFDEEGCPMPATYANFLVINGAVLVPTYAQPQTDSEALTQIANVFLDREIVPIDCRSLIHQHGSLHCCTMQYPAGVIAK